MIREDLSDLIYKTRRRNSRPWPRTSSSATTAGSRCWSAPCSIEKSERLSKMLEHRGIEHEVLNAKQHEREAEIIALAGEECAVTIAPTWLAAAPTSSWEAASSTPEGSR